MRYLDLTLPGIAENLALDEAMLLEAEARRGGEVLRLWEWPTYAVVLGAGGRLAQDVIEHACLADGVPIQRRASGGGTVLLGKGCLLFSLILAYERAPALREIRASYGYLLGSIRSALASPVPNIELSGTSDLSANGRKFSGNAQQRKRTFLLHHGSILYDFRLDLVGRYLRMPERQPSYRNHRDHEDFMMNLPASAEELRRSLKHAFQAEQEVSDLPEMETRRLLLEKYANTEWIRRR